MLNTLNHRKVQIKTTIRYHFIPTRRALIKTSIFEHVEKSELSVGGNVNVIWHSHVRELFGSSSYDPVTPHLGIYFPK